MTYLYLGLLAATIGMYIAIHIYQSKRGKRKLMCARSHTCTKVVTSKYSKTLGIPNETLGVGYYVLVAGFFASVLAFPILDTDVLQFSVALGAVIGVLFSLYLLYVQAFKLRTWCLWCLTSAFMTILLASAASAWIDHASAAVQEYSPYMMDNTSQPYSFSESALSVEE